MWQFKLNEWLEVKPLEITDRDKSLLVYLYGLEMRNTSHSCLFIYSISLMFSVVWHGVYGTTRQTQGKRNALIKFNSPPGKLGHLTIFCARGVGNLICKAFPGVGNWPLLGYAGENWTGSVRFQIIIYFQASKSLIAMNTCLDEI